MHWSRRELISNSSKATLFLLLSGPLKSDKIFAQPKNITPDDAKVIAAIAVPLLGDSLPEGERIHAITTIVQGVDIAIQGLPDFLQAEVSQLLTILRFPPTRCLIAGVWKSWDEAPSDVVEDFLEKWHYSSFGMLRSGYLALRELIMASYYGNPASWAGIEYPGPPVFVRN